MGDNPFRKNEQVKIFFDQTWLYLNTNVHVAFRSWVVREMLYSAQINIKRFDVLDVGCGNGVISMQFLPDVESLTLVDISENMLDIARKNTPRDYYSRIKFIQGDITELSTLDSYDLILGIGVLAHVVSMDNFFQKISMLTRSGGHVIVQFTDANQFIGKMIYAYNNWQSIRLNNYSLNKLSFSGILENARRHQLDVQLQKRYWPLFPGMGYLPDKVNSIYLAQSLRTPFISKLGSERLLLFKKK